VWLCNPSPVQELGRAAAYASTAVAAREAVSHEAEGHLLHLEKQRRVFEYWHRLTGQHGAPHLDVVMLATANDSYTWSIPSYPPLSGVFPSARINFMAQYIPVIDRVLVWGGREPTTRHIALADQHVYVLNLQTMRWSRPVVVDSVQTLDAPIAVSA